MKKIIKSLLLCSVLILAVSANVHSEYSQHESFMSSLSSYQTTEKVFSQVAEPCKVTVTVKVSVGGTSMSISVSQTADTCAEAAEKAGISAAFLKASFITLL